MPKTCQKTNKTANNGYSISHSHKKNKKIQHVNLHKKKIWCSKTKKYIKLLISTKAMKILFKI
uniref:Large ribosomal subunit protein bL28c n=1 Tax=Hildenbrandia rubra TaxID=31481 RepID=A0A1C9CFZ4_9FLOR|nr:ribosomal protein L28 [Hildenbrandia rubra]AOM67295.1 ribosomal protein L28 [Hildenbrandia rubra]